MFKKKILLGTLILAIGLSAGVATIASAQGQGPESALQEQTDGRPPRGQNGEGRGPKIDTAAAAETLGVSEADLQAALGEPGQGKPDLATVAAELGVTEEALIDAMGIPAGGPENGQQGQGPQGQDGGQRPQIDLAAAASELGVTEEALKTALGEPGQGKPDFAATAAELGVTEQALIDALGVPAGGAPDGQPNGNGQGQGQPSQS